MKFLCTVTSPNIARPLALHTSPSDYATFNQIKYFLYIQYQVAFGKRKTAKCFHFMLSLLSRVGFRQKLQNFVKKFLTINSNDLGFNIFTLIKLLIKEIVENNLVLLSLVYFVKVIHQREDIETFVKKMILNVRGLILLS